jgi:hypothetical protein
MEIKLNTDNSSTNYDLYKLANGVFHHIDHDGIKIDYGLDGVGHSVTITFNEFGWREAMKLETFMELANRLTDYTTTDSTEEEE